MTGITGRLCVGMALLTAALATGACEAQEQPRGLRLISADAFGITFMEDAPLDRARPGGPVEVHTWSFFDEPRRPGRGRGWNTRITRARIDCEAGTMSALHHTVYQDETLVDEVTPEFRMRPPIGEDKEAVMNWVCNPEEEPHETVVRDLAAARQWARTAWPTLNPDHPQRTQP